MWPTATTNVMKTKMKITNIGLKSVAIWICMHSVKEIISTKFITLLHYYYFYLYVCISKWVDGGECQKIQRKTAYGLDPIAFRPGSILRMDAAAFHLPSLKTLKLAEMSAIRSSLGFHFNRQHMNECVDFMKITNECRWQP